MLSYILILSKLPCMPSEFVYMMLFIDEVSLNLENGFILVTVIGLLNYLIGLEWNNFTQKTPDMIDNPPPNCRMLVSVTTESVFIDFCPEKIPDFTLGTLMCAENLNCEICAKRIQQPKHQRNSLTEFQIPKITRHRRPSNFQLNVLQTSHSSGLLLSPIPKSVKTLDSQSFSASRDYSPLQSSATILETSHNVEEYAVWFSNPAVIECDHFVE